MYTSRKLTLTFILVLLFIFSAASGERQSVGLVLSGGGAKGIAHIGVIKALEDHDIAVDYVTGTSMGAIIGGLYAAGYTPEEMLAMIQSPDFADWSSGKIDKKLYYYFAQTEDTPSFTSLSLGSRDSSVTQLLPASLISPLPMNYAFLELFSAYTAQCSANFDNLFVPFRCVCSDIYHKHKVVLSKGSFGDAIRASMSFPTVFRPIEIDSLLMYDGGIYDNFPVDVMHDVFNPDIMIGVNVSGPDGKPIPDDLFQQLEDMIIQNNDYSMPAQWGVKIDVPVRGFGLLAWDQAQQIYDIGYKTAEAMIDSISSRVTARRSSSELAERRRRFRAATPKVRFDSIEVSGGTKSQNDYIAYLFSPHKGDTIGLEQVKDAYYRALTPGRLENLVPQAIYRPGESLFTLRLKSTPKQNFEVGVGGYLTSSTTSMLFLSAGYRTMSFNSTATDLSGWIGQSYLAGALNSRLNLHTDNPSRLHLQIVASRHKYYENDKLFFEGSEPVFITKSEVFGRFLYEWAMGRHGLGEAGAGWGHLTSKYYRTDSDFPVDRRDEMTRNLGQLLARYRYNTLDSKMYPTTGASYDVTGMGVLGTYRYFPAASDETRTRDNRRWLQLESVTRNYFGLGKQLSVGVETDILLSTRKLLNSYYSSIVEAPGFNPTPASNNTFNTALRANSFVSAGIVPVWHPGSMFQLRGSFHGFLPLRPVLRGDGGAARYGKWFTHGEFFGEVAGVVTFPFASLSVYGNYTTAPTGTWNVGVSFGIYLLAPRFLR